MGEHNSILPIKHINEAIAEARNVIEFERSGEQHGLYCSWSKMNAGQGKYWRFNHVTEIAAPSGHGKSYVLNQLLDDFTDFKDVLNNDKTVFKYGVNRDFQFKDDLICVHFGLEMDSSDEIIRATTRRMNKSYHYLLSSELQEDGEFNTITDEEYKKIENRMKFLQDRPIYYIEFSGNIQQMYRTVSYLYSKKKKETGREPKLVVSLDHTLLVKNEDDPRDEAVVRAVSYFALEVRKRFKAMVILLGQCNQNLLSMERLQTPSLHYPNVSDIYYGAKVNWVCDNIWIFPYQPALNNIPRFGIDLIDTEDLVVGACVKSRKGLLGMTYYENRLKVGQFKELLQLDIERRKNRT